jgi:hypothetical protein
MFYWPATDSYGVLVSVFCFLEFRLNDTLCLTFWLNQYGAVQSADTHTHEWATPFASVDLCSKLCRNFKKWYKLTGRTQPSRPDQTSLTFWNFDNMLKCGDQNAEVSTRHDESLFCFLWNVMAHTPVETPTWQHIPFLSLVLRLSFQQRSLWLTAASAPRKQNGPVLVKPSKSTQDANWGRRLARSASRRPPVC